MGRSRHKPARHWILGILVLTIGLLTALSLLGPRWGEMTGPFGRLWVLLWAESFGVPALWLMVVVGLVWGAALVVPWPRGYLWGLSILIWPFVVVWDALWQCLAPGGDLPLLHGRLGAHLVAGAAAFFGRDALVQQVLALATLAFMTSVLVLRWGLPAAAREAAWRILVFCGRGLRAAGALGGRAAWLLVRSLSRGVALFGVRLLWPPLRAVGRHLAGWRPTARWRTGQAACGSAATPESAEPAEESLPVIAAGSQEGLGISTAQGEAEHAGQAAAARGPQAPSSPRTQRRPKAATPPSGARPVVPLELVGEAVTGSTHTASEAEIQANAALLKETLASFGIGGVVSEVHPGPVITRYEFTPGIGVTISQIVSRQDDLALAMRAPRVRLLAPIPGKAAVGVEIPNRDPALITFREVCATDAFRKAGEPLVIALGKDVAGRPFYTSLEKMPHLLVAGTTGSGKSVCLNTLIVSLLMRCTPEDLRLLMIDPKMLEFTMYNEIPHLARPVVTEYREAARALRWLTREMERRYRTLAGVGVRNIQGYHERRKQPPGGEELPPMPYVVVFVDELADLMISNQAEIEVPVARLAQMARAVGIHLILATQRPSVDVITGVIKANFPARIAFQVASRTDSRTVLDMNGAESLLGRGDMLFIPPGKAQAHRIHGAFLADHEIERIVDYLRKFPPAEPLHTIEQGEGGFEDEDSGDDPLYGEALRIVVAGQQGSTSLLQRRLRVGYTRAGRLMDMLERAGIVGPPDGSRAREVLVAPDYLEQDAVGSGRAAR